MGCGWTGRGGRGAAAADLSASQDMGEARAQACPGQGQETGGFAEAQTGRSVGRPMSRYGSPPEEMGNALLSPKLRSAEAQC